MELNNRTVLVTGGTSGIGLELSRVLVATGSTVIVCGRSASRLAQAQHAIPGLVTRKCDVSDPVQCKDLVEWLSESYGGLDILVNNAGITDRINFAEEPDAVARAEHEFRTNVIAPIRLTKLLLPILMAQKESAVINISSGLAYVPRAIYPFYNATKAALHSFTIALRLQLTGKRIRVIEVLFPAVDTPWHQGHPPGIAITVEQAVKEMVKGLEKGADEIRVAGVKLLYLLSRLLPSRALKIMNSLE